MAPKIFFQNLARFKYYPYLCTQNLLPKIEYMNNIESSKGEIVMYQPDETIRLEVRVEDETVWLTQLQLVTLFHSSKGNISDHISNIFEQGELKESATVRKIRTVQKEGKRMVNRTLTYYNLDVIISVGFRVNTTKGIEFRVIAAPTFQLPSTPATWRKICDNCNSTFFAIISSTLP